MKKLVSIVAVLCVVASNILVADVFASRTKITNPDGKPFDGKFTDGTGVKISYYLNDTATSVVVKVFNASTNALVATINAGSQGRATNPNSVAWNGSGAALGTKYYATITATGLVYSATDYKSIYFQQTSPIGAISTGIFTRGLDVNSNMNTPGFGYWYASNLDGGTSGYKLGLLRYNPDGSFAGTAADHPQLTNTDNSVFTWGATAPWTAAVDSKGRVYQAGHGGNFISRIDNDSALPKIIIRNISKPKGIYASGSGANLKLYIAADTSIYRANIGNSDTLTTPLELVATLGNFIRDVIIDDAGGMLVSIRTGVGIAAGGSGAAPGYVERYDISGTLPKKREDAQFSISMTTGLPIGFAKKSGPNKSSASDDTIYYSVRGASAADSATYGIWELTNIDGAFPQTIQIFKSGNVLGSLGGNNNANADIAIDWGGNVIWFENANEEIFMVTPPHTGSSTVLTTTAYDTMAVSSSAAVNDRSNGPAEFALEQNYPNPFNPSTMISYTMPAGGKVSVVIYDLLGNVVKELFNGEAQQGYNSLMWNAFNAFGAKVASGMYLYRITAQMSDGRTFTDAKRMLLLK
ncbi:MAG: FlgD immunoglobulin-like domain containing protein [Bacteroidota bacterium]